MTRIALLLLLPAFCQAQRNMGIDARQKLNASVVIQRFLPDSNFMLYGVNDDYIAIRKDSILYLNLHAGLLADSALSPADSVLAFELHHFRCSPCSA